MTWGSDADRDADQDEQDHGQVGLQIHGVVSSQSGPIRSQKSAPSAATVVPAQGAPRLPIQPFKRCGRAGCMRGLEARRRNSLRG
jgi:hypothetical protein